MDEARLFTLNEAAEATGLTVDALRQRIKRGKLRSIHGDDRRVMLRLDTSELDALKAAGAASQSTERPTSRPTSQDASRLVEGGSTIRAMESEMAALRDALDRERKRADQAEIRADQVEAKATEARTLAEQRGVDLMDAVERAARAEGQVEELRKALAEAQRPFWRKVLGLD